MKTLQHIVTALDGSPVHTIILNVRDRTATILHNNRPIHGVTYEQLESLFVMEAVAPNVATLLVEQGVLPASSWTS